MARTRHVPGAGSAIVTAYRPLPRFATLAFRGPAKTDGGRFGGGATVSDPVHVPTATRSPCSATIGRDAPDAAHAQTPVASALATISLTVAVYHGSVIHVTLRDSPTMA